MYQNEDLQTEQNAGDQEQQEGNEEVIHQEVYPAQGNDQISID